MKSLKDATNLSFEMFVDRDGKTFYKLKEPIWYKSKRHGKTITCPAGMYSDGASGPATDVVSKAWWVHDRLCGTKLWDDGTPCTHLQRSQVLYDILTKEGRWFRARSWFVATYLLEGWAW